MEETDRFYVVAWWSSGRTGIAKSSAAPSAIHFTSPPVLGGLEGRWTPEDLLLAAIASSYTTTFRILAENSNFEHTDLQVEVEGLIRSSEAAYSFAEVSIRANLMILDEAEEARALKLLHMAKDLCAVSRALAIRQVFEPLVTVAGPVA